MAFQRIALDSVANIKACHSDACSGEAEAVHRMRVAVTRLQAAVSFFSPMTKDAVWPRLKAELSWLNTFLGAARDSDVLAEYARHRRYRASMLFVDRQRLSQRRMRDHGRLAIALRSVRYRRLVRSLSNWVEGGPWLKDSKRNASGRQDLKAYSESKLRHWHQRISRKGRHLATLDASRRHQLRIRVKRYRYMLEALEHLLPPRHRAKTRLIRKSAKQLQGWLGDLRDLKRFCRAAAASGSVSDSKRFIKPASYRKNKRRTLNLVKSAFRELTRVKIK
jgi:CHAD domain-containing protein